MYRYFSFLCFIGLIGLLCWSSIPHARVLDIIVGGANQGLECKIDTDCGTDKYCNQEQFYCTSCTVPPHIWTGMECQCPKGTVEKSETECVECLTDRDCTGDRQFCNTDTNTCTKCSKPKEWKENICSCPDGTKETGDECDCIKPNTALDEFNFCACTLTPASCPTTDFNLQDCLCCPVNKPALEAGVCQTCAAIDPAKPIWDPLTKTCVECLKNTDCRGEKTQCNPTTKMCECTGPLFFWNATTQKCECPPTHPTFVDEQCQKCEDTDTPGLLCTLTAPGANPLNVRLRNFRTPAGWPISTPWIPVANRQFGAPNPLFTGTTYANIWNGFHMTCQGTLNVDKDGTYSFRAWADDSVTFSIKGFTQTAAVTAWEQPPSVIQIPLKKGKYVFNLQMEQNNIKDVMRNPYALLLDWQGPGFGWQPITSFTTEKACRKYPN